MKKFIQLTFAFFMLIVTPQFSLAFNAGFNPIPDGVANIDYICQYSLIKDKGIYSETLANGFILNQTLAQKIKYPSTFLFSPIERDRIYTLPDFDVILCSSDYPVSCVGNYEKINVICNKSIPFEKNISGNYLYIKFNASDINSSYFFIKIKYNIPDFIIENGNYEIAWLKTEMNPSWKFERWLTLPSKNSVIESWNNFEIVSESDYGWILKTKQGKDAMVWFRDYAKEQDDINQRDWIIIMVSLAFSIMFQFYFSLTKTKRTMNFWIVSSSSIVVTGMLILFNQGEKYPYLLMFFYILSLLSGISGYLSARHDNKQASGMRQLKDIYCFIKFNFLKILIRFILILVLITWLLHPVF